ncbi:MAG: polyketide cyclase [Gammaproteobacteria bacterium]|nr:polyketide cyclase [Gammaproteobacteria bacterium]
MWIQTHSKVYQGVSKEAIWQIWTDVNNWAAWHDDLDYCKMEGSFEVENYFMLKPKGMGPFKITLTEVIPGKKFTDCTQFFGAKMYDTHELKETPEGLRLISTMKVTGPLQYLWVMLVAKNVFNDTEAQNDALVKCARSAHE